MGETGSAAARLLLKHGAAVLVTDSAPETDRHDVSVELRGLGAETELGGHTAERFTEADTIVMSPGVPQSIPPVVAAVDAGVRVISELEMAFEFAQAPIVAVTGTNGKTTTCTLIHRILECAGISSVYTGNTDTPFSATVMAARQPEVYVIEVSSFQLELTESFRPEVGVLLNITPDHLDRYDDFDQYAATKHRMFAYQLPSDCAVVNVADPLAAALAPEVKAERVLLCTDMEVYTGCWIDHGMIRYRLRGKTGDLCKTSEIRIPGNHNIENVMAACTAAILSGADSASCRAAVREFTGLEHRIEYVGEAGNVTYVNDSKSTNVDSLRRALEAFDRPVVLIAGGLGKGEYYDSLIPLVETGVRAMVLIGEEAGPIAETLGAAAPAHRAESMDSAVRIAAELAVPGDIVLMSPGCASFDMFTNFKHRGQVFKDSVRGLEGLCAEKHT